MDELTIEDKAIVAQVFAAYLQASGSTPNDTRSAAIARACERLGVPIRCVPNGYRWEVGTPGVNAKR